MRLPFTRRPLPKMLGAAHLRAVIQAVQPGPCYHDGGAS